MSAKFFYYPIGQYPANHLEVIDLGEGLAELFNEFIVDANDGITHSGGIKRSVGRITEMITIQRDRMKLGEELAHQFRGLQNHLDRGGVCSFAADHTKCFMAGIKQVVYGNDTVIKVTGNPLFAMTANNGIAANDYLTFETQNPALVTETRKVSNTSVGLSPSFGGEITLSQGTAYSYPMKTMLRHYRFFPTLKRPLNEVGKNIITNEFGLLWSLSLKLVMDYDRLFDLMPTDDSGQFDINLIPPDATLKPEDFGTSFFGTTNYPRRIDPTDPFNQNSNTKV